MSHFFYHGYIQTENMPNDLYLDVCVFQKYVTENPFYERSYGLERAAAITLKRHGTMQRLEQVEKRRSERATYYQENKLFRELKNEEAKKENEELIKKERAADENVQELDGDSSMSAPMIVIGSMSGKKLPTGAQQKAPPAPVKAESESAASRKGISIKLTGKTNIKSVPATNPLEKVPKKIAKPLATVKKEQFLLRKSKQDKSLDTAPPPLETFLSILGSTSLSGKSLPIVSTMPNLSDGPNSSKKAASRKDDETAEEMRMLGIECERSRIVPKPPPMLPSLATKPVTPMAASTASDLYTVFYGGQTSNGSGRPAGNAGTEQHAPSNQGNSGGGVHHSKEGTTEEKGM